MNFDIVLLMTTKKVRKPATVTRYSRLTEEQRTRLTDWLVHQYARKVPIRKLAEETGRSYGSVRRMLLDAGVQLRTRGGAY